MIRRLALALALLFTIAVSPPARAAAPCTAFVSPPGPIPTWVAPGVVVCFHSGDYPHGLIRITAIGATYQAAPGELPRVPRFIGPGLELYGHDVTVSGIDINNDGASVPAIVLRGAGDFLSGNEIHNGRYNGVDVRGTGAVIVSNHIHDFDSGVAGSDAQCINVLPTGAGVTVTLNSIHDCSGDGVQAFFPNSVPGPAPDVAGGLISGNVFTRGTIGYSENAIDLKRGRGWTITNNLLAGYGREPVQLIPGGNPALFIHKWAANVLASGNVISDSAKGVQIFGNSGLDIGANPVSITVTGNQFVNVGPGYLVNVVNGIGVTVAPNLTLPEGIPTLTPTASNSPSPTSTPTIAVPTATATATATATETAVSGCWDLRHVPPLAIACP